MHHILCIHGIGKHSASWIRDKADGEESFEDLFKGTWKNFSRLGDFDDEVTLHSIHYDDEIDKIVSSWEGQAKSIKDQLQVSPQLVGEVEWFTETLDEVSKAKQEDQWAYTHLMDLLLFVGSPSLQDRLVNYVGAQLLDIIKSNKGSFSLIGHSMGTAMAHKVVQAMYNEEVKTASGVVQTLRGDFSFETVAMIANTSYALSRDRKDHYKGVVKPSVVVGAGCCSKWFNVNHKYDPVGQFMPFDYRENPDWLETAVSANGWHWDIELTDITARNIHSINHYFRDPAFHIPFFEKTFGVDMKKAEKRAAIQKFDGLKKAFPVKTFKASLETLGVSKLETFRDFYTAIKRLRILA